MPCCGGRYQWRLTVDGVSSEDWAVAFTTLAAQQPA